MASSMWGSGILPYCMHRSTAGGKCEKDLMMLQFKKPIICSFIVSGDKMSPTPSTSTFTGPSLIKMQG